MKTEVAFDAHAALVAFADAAVAAGVETRDPREAEALRAHAEAGDAFLVETDDPGLGSFHVYVGEPVPEEARKLCERRGGSFLLRVPSGRLVVLGVGTESPETGELPERHAFEVPPGDYAVSLLDATEPDIPALNEQQRALVDARDWRLYQGVNGLGAAGCLALAAGMIFVLLPSTRRALWFLLPLFFLPACAHALLKRLAGYRRVEKRIREHEAGMPQFALSLRRVESTEGLSGGWYRC